MKRLGLLVALLFSLALPASAQLPTSVISGVAYDLSGQPKAGVKIRVVRVTQAGSLISSATNIQATSGVDGSWSLTVPRSSTAWFCTGGGGVVTGLPTDCDRAVAKAIPSSSSALFAALTTVQSFPTGGFVVKDEGIALANVATTLNFIGSGVAAVESSPGVVNVTVSGGGGSGGIDPVTANRALVSDGSGAVAASSVTATELGYISGVTSALQSQLNAKQASGAYLTALTGDGTASGPGSSVFTLSAVNSSPGAYGGAGKALSVTVNDKGLTTSLSQQDIAIGGAQVTSGTVADARLSSNVVLADGTRAFTAAIGGVSPTTDDHLATKGYVDSLLVGFLHDQGNFDASGNLFPSTGGSGSAGAILKGDLWTISVAGTLGGTSVVAGDTVRALVNTPGQTSGNWAITSTGLGYVALNQSLADGAIYIGNSSGIGTAVTPTGDVTISNAGVTAIGAAKVTDAMLAGSISYSKLDLTGAVVAGDLAGSIPDSKLSTISTAGKVNASAVTGTLPLANGGTGATTALAARAALGVAIGSDVQAWDADLDTWALKTAPSGVVVGTSDTQTLTGKTISGASNTLSNIANASLSNSAVTIAGTSTSLGGSITLDTITGLSSTGIVKRTGTNALAIAVAGTDYLSAGLASSSGLTMSAAGFLGRSSGSGAIAELNAATATGLLTTFTGDSGSGGTKGLVPAPAIGDGSKYLRGDGTYASPSASALTITAVATNTTTSGSDRIVSVDASAGVRTLTLPSASGNANAVTEYVKIDSSANKVVIMNGSLPYEIYWTSGRLRFGCNSTGTAWYLMD